MFIKDWGVCNICAKVNRDHTKALLLNEEYDKKWANVISTHTDWKSGVATKRDSAWNNVSRKPDKTS